MPDATVQLEAGVKVFLYASVLLVIGASGLRWLLLPRASAELGELRMRLIERKSAGLALVASLCALGSCAARLWTHTAAAFGLSETNLDNLKLIALQSRWGQGWRVEVAAAFLLTIACAITLLRREAWPSSTIFAVVFTCTIPLLGHAAGNRWREALHSVHILAGGLWLGTLIVVLAVRIPDLNLNAVSRASQRRFRLALLRDFWMVALPGAATTVAAGVVIAFLYVGGFANLWATAYGRILLLKVALVGAIGICGFVNWRRLKRTIGDKLEPLTMILLEAALTGALVLVTALLTETGHPG